MKRKVRVTGFNAGKLNWPAFPAEGGEPDISVSKSLKPVPREEANLEAEEGETVVTDLNKDGIPQHFKIAGKPHSKGGTPLNLPPNSFIFSKSKDLTIKDPDVQKMFGKPESKSGYTPAELAKKYDINKYRQILADPNSDDLQRKTAELMITNYNLKLGKLALAQESIKGFPQGIPFISMPYLESNGIDPTQFIQTEGMEEMPSQEFKYGGAIDKYQKGGYTVKDHPQGGKVYGWDDGAVTWIKPNGKEVIIKTGNPDWKPSDKSTQPSQTSQTQPKLETKRVKVTIPTSRNISQLDPYGVFQKEKVEEFAPQGAIGRINKVATYQPRSGDQYGTVEIDNEQFLKNNPKFNSFFQEKFGRKFDKSNESDVEEFQKFYNKNLLENAYNALKSKGLTPELALQKAQGLVSQLGFDMTAKPGHGNPKAVDKKFGDFTSSRMEIVYNEPEKEKAKTPIAQDEKKPAPVEQYTPDTQVAGPGLPGREYWLQDIINTAGAASDYLRIKKYHPWQATPAYYLPEATFYDPNRELAANSEQAKTMADSLATFAGPQALSARTSQIQGQAAKNAADILSIYNNLNVGVANEFAARRADVLNKASQQRAELATNLHDKNAILNQQFDNAKNMAREQMRRQFVNAITNKEMTYNLNQLFPQYNIHPGIGGGIDFTTGRSFSPESSGEDRALSLFEKYRDRLPATVSDDVIWKITKDSMGGGSSDDSKAQLLEALSKMRT